MDDKKPHRSMLIEAALTDSLGDVVTRFCDGQWSRLPELWDVPFEEIVEAARRRGMASFVVDRPCRQGYWLTRTDRGFEVFYLERGARHDTAAFTELEPAFRHWQRCHLRLHLLDV